MLEILLSILGVIATAILITLGMERKKKNETNTVTPDDIKPDVDAVKRGFRDRVKKILDGFRGGKSG